MVGGLGKVGGELGRGIHGHTSQRINRNILKRKLLNTNI